MTRGLYSLLLWLLTPAILLRLLWRARRQPEYLHHVGERFGFYPQPHLRGAIWVHAVSVGETRAAQPLIEALRQHWPERPILLTGMTPTGRDTARQLYGDNVTIAYLPYDQNPAVDRFFGHFFPAFGILMETEIWPNLLAGARRHRVPLLLANGRLSARSAGGYQRFGALARPAFAALGGVAAQTAEDARRFEELGATDVEVCGNLKFDVAPPAALLALGRQWRETVGKRPVWLAASTREGEEPLILEALRQAALVDALLVIVPRHPQRFDEVAALIRHSGLGMARRSDGLPETGTQVWLGNSMGELAAYYAMADLAFIGGSLLPFGGQNLIEACACGCPVLVGPHTFNFTKATEDAIAAGAALRVSDATELGECVRRLLQENPESLAAMRQATAAFAAAHRGATERVLEFIARRTDQAGR
jgi:3-deoxy-D-manno-octulosonic-acid transferase